MMTVCPSEEQELVANRATLEYEGYLFDEHGYERHSRVPLSYEVNEYRIDPGEKVLPENKSQTEMQEEIKTSNIDLKFDVPHDTELMTLLDELRLENPSHEEKSIYQPLPNEAWFRFLIIEPGTRDDPIVCRLHSVELERAKGKYEALSYCWNDQRSYFLQRPIDITCNNEKISVQSSLWEALKRIRLGTRPRTIWADALCINQQDTQERSTQVQIMSTIYRQASRTLIWLGTSPYYRTFGPNREKEALSTVCRLVNSWDERAPADFHSFDEEYKTHETIKPFVSNGHRFTHSELGSLRELFCCRWFSRRWVIQEVVLAHSALVLWENLSIKWSWIGIAAAILRTQYDHFVQDRGMNEVYNAYLIFRLSEQPDLAPLQPSFLGLLRFASRFLVTDPRDAIYALLPLTTKENNSKAEPFLIPDYSIEPGVLFRRAANRFIDLTNSLSVLSDAGISTRSNITQVFASLPLLETPSMTPSWVPLWGQEPIFSMLAPWSSDDSFHTSRGLPLKRYTDVEDSCLAVDGIIVSTIFHVQSPWEENLSMLVRTSAFSPIDSCNLALMARTLCGSRNAYGRLEKKEDAMMLSFLAALTNYIKRAPRGTVNGRLRVDVDPKRAEGEDPEKYQEVADNVCQNRGLFVTVTGHLGLGPSQARPGDVVAVLGGGSVPYILRPIENEGKKRYLLVGESYVDDLINGEAVEAIRAEKPHRGPFNPNQLFENLVKFDGPELFAASLTGEAFEAQQMLDQLAKTRYERLRVERVEII